MDIKVRRGRARQSCDRNGKEVNIYESSISLRFPALVFYRNGEHVRYPGRVGGATAVLKWLTSEKTINVPGVILKVNELMLGELVH